MQRRQKEVYDQRLEGSPYQVGNLVWLHCPAVPRGRSRKLHRLWQGPFEVIKGALLMWCIAFIDAILHTRGWSYISIVSDHTEDSSTQISCPHLPLHLLLCTLKAQVLLVCILRAQVLLSRHC